MLNIVVPMAGRGSRFAVAGYQDPKPLISFGGKPMIQWVVENIRPSCPHRFTFICLSEHLERYPSIEQTLRSLCANCSIIKLDQVTDGAACTVLLAKQNFSSNDPLMIANADQFVELNMDEYLKSMEDTKADGLIMTFYSNNPKWSYCRMNLDGTVGELFEKKVVSNEATVGIYNFRRGLDFVYAAEEMIRDNLRVNNEFYVAPAYNKLIKNGLKVITRGTGMEYSGMYGLGVPLDLEFFKTTIHYRNRSHLDTSSRETSADELHRLTQVVKGFVCEKNIAGLNAILSDDVVLYVRGECELNGKDCVLNKLLVICETDNQKRGQLGNRQASSSDCARSGTNLLGVQVLNMLKIQTIIGNRVCKIYL